MKNLLLLSGFMMLSILTAPAQTLAFSQVLLVDNSQTVPANRVWKIVSASSTSNFSSSSITNTSTPSGFAVFTYFINSTEFSATRTHTAVSAGNSQSTSSQSRVYLVLDRDIFPFWLPAGSSLAPGSGITHFSVIEFTVVP